MVLDRCIQPLYSLRLGSPVLPCQCTRAQTSWCVVLFTPKLSLANQKTFVDALLRSSLYSHFSESLSGLATIRAYGEQDRFLKDNQKRVDIENRAYWLTVTNQRWLGIRLDFLGIVLTFVVAILTVGTRFSISPSQTGVTLSYIISIQQSFGWLVRQIAEVENDMNSVERIVHYADKLEQEAPHLIPEKKPQGKWPSEGRVEMNQVVLKYRPELPEVLKGMTMAVNPGEKIGIVGRYVNVDITLEFTIDSLLSQDWCRKKLHHDCVISTRRANFWLYYHRWSRYIYHRSDRP